MNNLHTARRILRHLHHIQTDWTAIIEDLAISDQSTAPAAAIEAFNVTLAYIYAWADMRTRTLEAAEARQGGYRCPVCRETFGHDSKAFQRHAATSDRCRPMILAALDLISQADKQSADNTERAYCQACRAEIPTESGMLCKQCAGDAGIERPS